MNLKYRDNYWDDPALKKQFIDFLIDIFGLDLSRWDSLGYWDNKYRPFSYFDESGKLVSSLCIYSMDMTVMGKRCQVAQISAVGTVPEYRRKGLNSKLTGLAMEWAGENHDFFYLFADEEAFPFYKHCRFRKVEEHGNYYPVEGMAIQPGAEKLNIERQDHRDLIYRIAKEREPVSDMLGISNAKLFMFWCLYFLKDNIYYIRERDLLVLYKRVNDRVIIFDIVGKDIPIFAEIYPYIADASDKTIEFRFMVDKLGLDRYEEIRLEEDNGTHLYGDFPLGDRKFIIPITAQA